MKIDRRGWNLTLKRLMSHYSHTANPAGVVGSIVCRPAAVVRSWVAGDAKPTDRDVVRMRRVAV